MIGTKPIQHPYGSGRRPHEDLTAPLLGWTHAQRAGPAPGLSLEPRRTEGPAGGHPAARARRPVPRRGRGHGAQRCRGEPGGAAPARRRGLAARVPRGASRPVLMHTPAAARRRIKVHGANLGPLLCWSIVFADIGTSIYYVPGILSASGYNKRAAIFLLMTLFVFVLLSLKYAEVTWRNPEGGGVVTISSRALHPFAGLVGGCFIIVDYYLTAGISAFSGISYLAVVIPAVGWANAVPGTLVALALLAALNIYGIRESASVSLVAAAAAAAGQLVVVIVVAMSLGPAGIAESIRMVGQGPPPLTPLVVITGFGAAFLAFSGLESVAQIAPAMRTPRRVTAYKTMALVILTMAVTSPLLTLWSTTIVPDPNSPDHVNQLLSLLAGQFGGNPLAAYVAISGSVLLIFASNTAIIGAYHVFLALTRMGFLPRAVEVRNSWRRTP